MNTEIKQRWIEMLRSNEYKQGFGILHKRNKNNEECYCVMGVLAKAANCPETFDELSGQYRFSLDSSFYTNTYNLSNTFVQSIGLDYQTATRITTLNDADQLSFTELADWIESNVSE